KDSNMKDLQIFVDQIEVEDVEEFAHEISFTDEGIYKVSIRATDLVDHISEEEVIIKIDQTAPKVTFETDGNDKITKEGSTKVIVTDEGSGLDRDSLEYAWSTSSDTPS